MANALIMLGAAVPVAIILVVIYFSVARKKLDKRLAIGAGTAVVALALVTVALLPPPTPAPTQPQSQQPAKSYVEGEILVTFKGTITEEQVPGIIQRVVAAQYKLVYSAGPSLIYKVTVPKGKEAIYIERFKEQSEVQAADYNHIYYTQ